MQVQELNFFCYKLHNKNFILPQNAEYETENAFNNIKLVCKRDGIFGFGNMTYGVRLQLLNFYS